MEILKKLLGLMIQYDRWLLVIAVILIVATSILTVSQAELGQAFFSVVKNIDRNTNKNAQGTGTGITAFSATIKTFLEKKND